MLLKDLGSPRWATEQEVARNIARWRLEQERRNANQRLKVARVKLAKATELIEEITEELRGRRG